MRSLNCQRGSKRENLILTNVPGLAVVVGDERAHHLGQRILLFLARRSLSRLGGCCAAARTRESWLDGGTVFCGGIGLGCDRGAAIARHAQAGGLGTSGTISEAPLDGG
jgi:hypothetical protein